MFCSLFFQYDNVELTTLLQQTYNYIKSKKKQNRLSHCFVMVSYPRCLPVKKALLKQQCQRIMGFKLVGRYILDVSIQVIIFRNSDFP